MISLLTDQKEADRLFDRWASAMIGGSSAVGQGWAIEGSGVTFSNYGDGRPGRIRNSVMLGIDTSLGNGVVKIVRPAVAQADKGKLTAIGRNDRGHAVLLRQGWLKQNPLSRAVREDFASLTGLKPILTTPGRRTPRDWYLVADLDVASSQIVEQTAAFANACARARSKAGGAVAAPTQDDYRLGLDEKGRIKKVTITGGTRDVIDLQGYVHEALKSHVGTGMSKPTRGGFAADAMIEAAALLIEIKTGVSAHDVYEAVGQLALYPSLLNLPSGLDPILLIPVDPPLRPQLAAALASEGIDVFFYSVGLLGKKPKIRFSRKFLARCGVT